MVRAVCRNFEDFLHRRLVGRCAADAVVDEAGNNDEQHEETEQLVRAVERVGRCIPDLEVAAAIGHGETDRNNQQQHEHGQPMEDPGR